MKKQIGGSHYDMPISPLEYILKNNIGFCEGNVIKYVSRYKRKGGSQDLRKARHYLDVLIEEVEIEDKEESVTLEMLKKTHEQIQKEVAKSQSKKPDISKLENDLDDLAKAYGELQRDYNALKAKQDKVLDFGDVKMIPDDFSENWEYRFFASNGELMVITKGNNLSLIVSNLSNDKIVFKLDDHGTMDSVAKVIAVISNRQKQENGATEAG